jgi:hypothetical protein
LRLGFSFTGRWIFLVLDVSTINGSTVISFDSNGSALGGSTGVLVTLTGVAFTSEADSVIAFADNLLV